MSISGKLVDGQSGLFLEGVPIMVSIVEDGERALADLEIAQSDQAGIFSFENPLFWSRRLGPIRRFNRGDPWAGTITVTLAPPGYEAQSFTYPFGPLLAPRENLTINLGSVQFVSENNQKTTAR